MTENITFHIRGDEDFIPLQSLLKAVNVVQTGSEAAAAISVGMVLRDGAPELRRRAKIRSGEIIEFDHYRIEVL